MHHWRLEAPESRRRKHVRASTTISAFYRPGSRQLVCYLKESRNPSVTQLMEVNREGSGLDQEHMAGRFTLTRYILYLLPVIGFIGTVEGISRALMNISMVLPMVKNLDGFLTNLTSVTAALQIAFDSTLLALFLKRRLDAGANARVAPFRGRAGAD